MRRMCVPLLLMLLLLMALPLAAHADVLGVPVPEGTTTLDLTGVTKADNRIKTLISDLEQHPEIETVDLTGVNLSTANKAKLVAAFPEVHFVWTVKLGNATISSEDTVMDLDTPKGEVKLSQIAQALDALPNIERVIMNKYRPSLNGMRDYLLTPYPDVWFDWTLNWLICDGRRVYLRSDATAFSTGKGRQDPRYTATQIWERLQHFPHLLAIDVGHNNVTDLSFLSNFPKLRRLIVIDSKKHVTDISVLAQLPDLEYVELFMQDITDISALANHEHLLDLNLCHNNVTDLSPLYSCPNLQRLWISYNPNLTQEEIDKLQAVLPNCVIETESYESTGAGWREHDRYFILIESFENNTYIPFAESQPVE
ncbi:MAG: leucine-rich repeat domain-containing protein [Clostridia bacterium]|nr:leucine-rich repeat domain-containing protein [Clostridia bacterium]